MNQASFGWRGFRSPPRDPARWVKWSAHATQSPWTQGPPRPTTPRRGPDSAAPEVPSMDGLARVEGPNLHPAFT